MLDRTAENVWRQRVQKQHDSLSANCRRLCCAKRRCEEVVEFKRYLLGLCEDLSDLLSQEGRDCGIVVEGAQVQVPT